MLHRLSRIELCPFVKISEFDLRAGRNRAHGMPECAGWRADPHRAYDLATRMTPAMTSAVPTKRVADGRSPRKAMAKMVVSTKASPTNG